jgi:N-carbamoylputrescine amidase
VAQNQRDAWEVSQRSRGANGVYVASVNRVTGGQDQILRPFVRRRSFGEIVAHSGGEREEILIAKCELQKIEETRQSWPFLRDRRIDAYDALQTRFLESRDGR